MGVRDDWKKKEEIIKSKMPYKFTMIKLIYILYQFNKKKVAFLQRKISSEIQGAFFEGSLKLLSKVVVAHFLF